MADSQAPVPLQLESWMYQRIVEDAPEAILVADPAGAIVFWNAAAEKLFGYSAADTVGRSLDLIIRKPSGRVTGTAIDGSCGPASVGIPPTCWRCPLCVLTVGASR